MNSHNPVLTRTPEFHGRGSGWSPGAAVMTLDSVVVRSAAMFAILLGTAVPAFLFNPGFGVVLVAMLIGFGLALVVTFSRTANPVLVLAYAAFEGVFVGGISALYANEFGGNVVPQAVLGTLSAFGAMLFAYKTGMIRATARFRKTLIIAALGYLVFGLLHFAGVVFGAWDSIYFGDSGPNVLGVGLSLVGVVLASLYLVLDFDMIEDGIRNGMPENFAWRCAFSLVVTLVWLYLEILRLVSILSGRD